MSRIRQLEYALSLAKHGHFGKAARVAGVTQPALTKAIKQMEARYGVLLFERGRRGVVPTAYGRALLERAQGVVERFENIGQELASLAGLFTGQISIGAGPLVAARLLPEVLSHFVGARPGLSFRVVPGQWRDLTAALFDRAIDIFVGDMSDAESDPQFEIVPLPPEKIIWFCRAGHPLAKQRRISRARMLGYPIVVPTLPPWAEAWFREGLSESGMAGRRPVAVDCNDYALLRSIVKSTDSICGATRSVLGNDLREGRIVELAIDAPVLESRAGVIYLKDRVLPPVAHELIRAIESTAKLLTARSRSSPGR